MVICKIMKTKYDWQRLWPIPIYIIVPFVPDTRKWMCFLAGLACGLVLLNIYRTLEIIGRWVLKPGP
jgi:hypothetical protein